MKNLKYLSLLAILLCVCSFGLTSCSSDDDDSSSAPAPVIKLNEANIEGNELCVEADIVAQGRIAAIVINILDATGNTVKVTNPVSASKYLGVLNIDDFHVHVDITGKNVAVGDLLKLLVVDANGHSTTAQKSITQEVDDDEEHDHD